MIYAAALALGRCKEAKCQSVHVELFDEERKLVARGLIPIDNVAEAIKEMQRLADEIRREQNGRLEEVR